jgi:Uma2 family endonuclease
MSGDEFLARWDAMPDLKHAELIDGVVYMASPVSFDHGKFQVLFATWVSNYAADKPGCWASTEATWLMEKSNVPQPDVTLRIVPEYGGQSGVRGSYHSGAPELAVEVAASSYARDFGIKKRLYERMGVREYLIAQPGARKVTWFVLTSTGYEPLKPGPDGIYRSVCFPGLWLDAIALWNLDRPRLNAAAQLGLATPEHAAFAAQLAARKP